MSLRVLVVDDEPVARRRLRRLLDALPDLEVVAEAEDGTEALERVREHAPDVAFLDVRMPGMDGLELARALAGRTHVVFTTAHDAHALAAFEAAAVDYLLKPVRRDRLERAVERVRSLARGVDAGRVAALLEQVAAGRPAASDPQRIVARRGDVVELFDPRDVTRFRAASGYVVFAHGGREHVVDETLNALEARLAPLGFFRAHRSELVSLGRVRALHRQDDAAVVELDDGQRAAVSRKQLPELKRRLGIA